MTNPVPRRAPKAVESVAPGFWLKLLNGVYLLWEKLNRAQLEIGDSTIYSVTGTPEGSQTGNIGDMAMRTDGGVSTAFYVKETGLPGTNTGGVAK